MATSQFTIYSSADLFGPGPVSGVTGSLLPVLDACLVNGYGSGSSYYKPAAGWTKPFANSASIGCYKQASGSQYTMLVNDAGQHAFTGRDANVVGWKLLANLSSSIIISSQSLGTGWGQFPLPAQSLGSGSVVWKKSSTADATTRGWIIAADAYTMYMWILDGTATAQYSQYGFGDFYSLGGTADNNRCFIIGRGIIASVTQAGYDMGDAISLGSWWAGPVTSQLSIGFAGHYIAGPASGFGGSIRFTKKGDSTLSTAGTTGGVPSIIYGAQSGVLSAPNATDNKFYLSYVWLIEEPTYALRGKLRGYYQMCHPVGNFADGQIINGSGDFAGKIFLIIKSGVVGGFWAIETSPTVITN